jgi:hypothetical protein
MLTLLFIAAAGGAWLAYRNIRGAFSAMPRANDDVVFF